MGTFETIILVLVAWAFRGIIITLIGLALFGLASMLPAAMYCVIRVVAWVISTMFNGLVEAIDMVWSLFDRKPV